MKLLRKGGFIYGGLGKDVEEMKKFIDANK